MNIVKKQSYLPYGILDFDAESPEQKVFGIEMDKSRLLLIQHGGMLEIDFIEFTADRDELFFVNAGQSLCLGNDIQAILLYFDKDLYHQSVGSSCQCWKGISFNCGQDKPAIKVPANARGTLLSFFEEIRRKSGLPGLNQHTDLNILIKQLIITTARISVHSYPRLSRPNNEESEFYHNFKSLIDANFLMLHSPIEYATLCGVSAKTLNRKIFGFSKKTPRAHLYERKILEAKRLLAHTQLNVKQIARHLGYDDYSYFIRFFTKQTNLAPYSFRRSQKASQDKVA
ncbi:helix-turn-helix domain-containing protein [Pedobacter sp.]|uniref:helix-turn-helix domain-containing protein n=1 Tax=Pedobacter sp. TaxID=1411316 RepID=UPI003C68FA83